MVTKNAYELVPWITSLYRLVSLREIMEEIEAVLYLWLDHWSNDLQRLARDFSNSRVGEDDDGITLAHLKNLQAQCERLGFTTTAHHLDMLIVMIEAGRDEFGELGEIGRDINTSLNIEIQNTQFLALLPRRLPYYSNWRDGWEQVLGRLPNASDDIEEGSKCYALGRYAACVYHMMQVADLGAIELGKLLGVNDPLPGIGPTDSKLKQVLNKKYEDLTDFERVNRAELEQLSQSIEAMKNAWRNKSSHFHGRMILLPGNSTPEIAFEVLAHTRAFLRRLVAGILT